MIEIKTNLNQLEKWSKNLKRLAERMKANAKKATVRTAFELRKSLDARQKADYHVRKPQGHMRVKIENTEDGVKARVGSSRPWMQKAVEGGEKASRPGKILGVPGVGEGLPRATIMTPIQQQHRAAALLREAERKNGKSRFHTITTKTGKMLIMSRKPEEKERKIAYTTLNKQVQPCDDKWWSEEVMKAASKFVERQKEAVRSALGGAR